MNVFVIVPAYNEGEIIGRVLAVEKEGYEIQLSTSRQAIGNKILGWRLLITDALGRMKYVRISGTVRLILRPIWKFFRKKLLDCHT